MPEYTKIELRSEEVQDILTKVPHWMIRWGTVLIFGIIIMLFFISWFLKYPDVVKTEIVITTNNPPEKLLAKTSGRIEAILIKDNSKVVPNIPLAVIENAAKYQDVFKLKRELDKTDSSRTNNNFPFEALQHLQLGEIESAFALFQKDCVAEGLNTNLQPFKVDIKAQIFENKQLKNRLSLLLEQQKLNQSEIQLQINELNRFETLHKKGVISIQDLETKKLQYLQSEKNYRNLLSSISQLKSTLIDNERISKTTQINSTKENSNLERSVTQSYYQLKKAIKDWEMLYVLKSDIAGEVTFLQVWTINQTITSGDQVFAIIPSNNRGYIGKLKAPALNSGKIKVNQKVNIRLANFPDREFGILKGKIRNISQVPDKEGNLLLDVVLPNGLVTSYKNQIPFQQEMKGSAEIITEDLRLLERILYQFRDIF